MAEDQRPTRRPSLAARLLGGSARSARVVAEATGIDDAMDLATEEAIVRALESPAVERALVRVLEGPAVEEAVERLLASPAVERAAINALDSPLVDKVWDRLLQSDEAQKLVERVAEAPEVRAAITQQGFGLLEDIGRQIRRIAHGLDGAAEGLARRLTFRSKQIETVESDNAGLVTRALAVAVDGAIVAAVFFAGTAVVDFTVSAFAQLRPVVHSRDRPRHRLPGRAELELSLLLLDAHGSDPRHAVSGHPARRLRRNAAPERPHRDSPPVRDRRWPRSRSERGSS